MTAEKLYQAVSDLVLWVEERDGNVDHGVFADECAKLAVQARQLLGLRSWAGGPVGVCALDFACAALQPHGRSVSLPALAWKYPGLPGATEFRRHHEHES